MVLHNNDTKAGYYAVIFSSKQTMNQSGYEEMAAKMLALAKQQPGFLDFESVRDKTGLGISVSYWKDKESIKSWKSIMEHRMAQTEGKNKWYSQYKVQIARAERHYEFHKSED